MVNILLRDVISVNLCFDMCSHCLSTVIPLFRLKKQQIRFGRIDLTPSGEFIVTHDYPTESVYFQTVCTALTVFYRKLSLSAHYSFQKQYGWTILVTALSVNIKGVSLVIVFGSCAFF